MRSISSRPLAEDRAAAGAPEAERWTLILTAWFLTLLLSKLPGAPESALRKLGGEQRSDTLQDLLVGSVHELGENGQDHRYGWGRLNVLSAMASAVQLGYVQLA